MLDKIHKYCIKPAAELSVELTVQIAFRGFCQVHFYDFVANSEGCPIHPHCNGLYNQIQHENHFYLPVNIEKPKFVAFLVLFCTTASFIAQISSFENVSK